jgi:hypothetical protein
MKMIMKPYIVNIFGLLLLHFLISSAVIAQPILKEVPYGNNKEVGKYIPVNGVKIYYEIYGKGDQGATFSCVTSMPHDPQGIPIHHCQAQIQRHTIFHYCSGQRL